MFIIWYTFLQVIWKTRTPDNADTADHFNIARLLAPKISIYQLRQKYQSINYAKNINLSTDNADTDKADCFEKRRFLNAKLGVSSIISKKDIDVLGITQQVNNQMKHICDESGYTFIDNSIIDESGLNNSN